MSEKNEMSLEAIYSAGIGLSTLKFSESKEELFDGDIDSLRSDIASTENYIEFSNIYQDLAIKNANDKIKMLKKIGIHTRGNTQFHKSIEAYIYEQSMEEEAIKEANGDTNAKTDGKTDKPKTDQQKEGFFRKAWEMIKKFFEKVFGWIKRKIDAFIGLFKSNNDEFSQLENELPPEDIDKLSAALKTYDFMDQSEDGGIRLVNGTMNKFNDRCGVYIKMCNWFSQIVNEVLQRSSKPEGMNNDLNKIKETMSTFSGIGQIPSFEGPVTKESIEKYNNDMKKFAQHLNWKHDPNYYTKYFTGNELVQGKSQHKFTISDFFGTNDFKTISSLINDTTVQIREVQNKISNAYKIVQEASNKFDAYLNKNNIISGSGENTKLNENFEKNKDDSDETVTYRFQFYTTVRNIFNIISKLQLIVSQIATKILASAQLGRRTVLAAARESLKESEKAKGIFGKFRTRKEKKEYNEFAKSLKGTKDSDLYGKSETTAFGSAAGDVKAGANKVSEGANNIKKGINDNLEGAGFGPDALDRAGSAIGKGASTVAKGVGKGAVAAGSALLNAADPDMNVRSGTKAKANRIKDYFNDWQDKRAKKKEEKQAHRKRASELQDVFNSKAFDDYRKNYDSGNEEWFFFN